MERPAEICRCLIALSLIFVFAVPATAYTVGDWTVEKLTDNLTHEAILRISDGTVVWQGYSASGFREVFRWKNGVTTQLSENGFGAAYIDVSGDTVVWADLSVGSQIFYYDGTLQALTYSWESVWDPIVDQGNAAWLKATDGVNKNIFHFDGTETTQLTDTATRKWDPQISGSTVVWWEAGNSGTGDIFYHDGTEAIRLTDNPAGNKYPHISDGGPGEFYLTYGEVVDGFWEILQFDGTNTVNLSNTPTFSEESLRTCGSRTVWLMYDGEYKIYLHDGSSVTLIDPPSWSVSDPQVSETLVAWSGGAEIYVYDGADVTQLTDDVWLGDHDPRVSGGTVVWLGEDEDGDDEVFMAYKTQSVVAVLPEAQALRIFGATPNPFNPTTEIVFTNSRAMNLGVRVFDLRGRLVADLGERVYEVGDHAVSWQGQDQLGQNVPSGVYFYVVEGESQRQMGKMTLVE